MATLNIRILVSRILHSARGPVVLASACTAAALAPQSAFAADATAVDELQVVTVTGIRGAIDQAISIKRNNDDVVEVISAEDIGKLPDTSIAESLARLPGLTVQRSGANDSAISIRGFGPDFNGTLLNGREQASTGDNRAIEFDQYPAELMSNVVVYKTNDPAIMGQGIAGTVDMQTTRPLEYGKRALVFDFRADATKNGNLGGGASTRQYRGSFSYVDQFFDNTLGLTVGYSRVDLPVQTTETDPYGPLQGNTCPGYPCFNSLPLGTFVPGGAQSTVITGLDRRDGTIATLEWKPNDAFATTLDTYYTDRIFQSQQGYLASTWPGHAVTNPTYTGDNYLESGTLANIVPIVGITQDIIHDQVLAAGWNTRYTTHEYTLETDFGVSHAVHDENSLLTYGAYQSSDPAYHDTLTFNLAGNGSSPSFKLGNPYNDPSHVLVGSSGFGSGYATFPHSDDLLKTFRVDVSHPLGGWFSTGIVGFNYDNRTKNKQQPEASLSAANGAVQLPAGEQQPSFNMGFAGGPAILNWNVPAVLSSAYAPFQASSTKYSYLVGKTWEVDEKLGTFFVKANLDHELTDSVKLRGNLGLQVIHTQQFSSANYWNGAGVNPAGGYGVAAETSNGTSYNDVLPAANLVFVLPAQQTVRFSAAREVMRPRMDQLADTFSYSISRSGGQPSANGGNPLLSPWRADAVDLSYEKYFDNKAYVAVTGFYKNLKNYIYSFANTAYDFTALNSSLPPGYILAGANPVSSTGVFTQWYNGKGGRTDGLEFTVSLPGEMLTDYLSGFGVMASVSETNSSISIPGSVAGVHETNIPLPGLSKTVWQATMYYEKYGFSARVATRYRSDYVGEIQGFGDARTTENVRHEQLTDFQTGYEFQEGRYKNLAVVFQVNNLTNAPYVDYQTIPSHQINYQTYGRQFFLGAKYKL